MRKIASLCPLSCLLFSFDDQWESCSLKLYGCLSFPPTLYLHIKNRWFQRFPTSCLSRLLKTSMQTAISFSRTIRSFLKYTAVDSSGYIYGGVDKAGYLRKTSVTNKPSLSFFFFFLKNHSTFLDSGHLPFPLCAGMEVTGGSVTMGRRKPKVRPSRKIKLNLTSKADG